MKKIIKISVAITCVFIFTAFIANPVSAQTKPASHPIPADVVKIAEKSCKKCHMEPGNEMALSHNNLSKWDKYSPEKQAEKAELMCKKVTKGKMPPKHFRKENPDKIPTAADVKVICDWAATIQPPK
jgi:hypothetical protein